MSIQMITMSDIIISDEFQKTIPKVHKVNRIKDYVKQYGKIDKPVVLSGKMLLDGYVRYLVAKELGIKEIPCKQFKTKPHKYIVGQFTTGSQYVWKLPDNISVNVGDKVLVMNKDSKTVVIVRQIFKSYDKSMRKHKSVLKVVKMCNNNIVL